MYVPACLPAGDAAGDFGAGVNEAVLYVVDSVDSCTLRGGCAPDSLTHVTSKLLCGTVRNGTVRPN